MRFKSRATQVRYQFALLFAAYVLGQIAIAFIPVNRTEFAAVADDVAVKPNYGGDLELLPVSVNKSEKKSGDWPQWGGNSTRNNVPDAKNIPTQWDVGSFDRKTGAWQSDGAVNIKWVAAVGSQTYGNPVVANGKVFVGTNNGNGYVARYPATVDLGCLLCFSEKDGKFLWQHSSEKLKTGRVHDWPLQGICCAPLVEGDRAWFVTSRGEVRCVDTEGFYDGENDGEVQDEVKGDTEADVVWVYNMMQKLGVSQHNMC
ncbi:MAG: PQQ-binding-like beta-propeller repeat protein, partial [Planctomycetales bacterium]|nr:PQQ-binding-like beta-propeller repeat protein [Planctomycetales bacterium]